MLAAGTEGTVELVVNSRKVLRSEKLWTVVFAFLAECAGEERSC